MNRSTKPLIICSLALLLIFLLGGCGDPSLTEVPPRSTNTPGVVLQTSTGDQPAVEAPAVPASDTALEPVISTTFITPLGQDAPIEGAKSTLVRTEHGLYMTFVTSELGPGDAYTIWWMIFNNPENCTDPCSLDDVALFDADGNRLYAEDGAPLANAPGREATGFSRHRATGSIIDMDGSAEFRAHLFLGDDFEADFGPGLLNPLGADVHLVARTHGPAIPGMIHEQMNTPWGGCPEGWPKDPCGDTQVAIHGPPAD